MVQSYQEVSGVILEELVANSVNFKEVDYQKYFYNLKMKKPENYEGLVFDTNGDKPYSENLSSIFMDFLLCGFMDFNKKIIPKSLEGIMEYIKSVK
jgi:hypothetical protein